MGMDEHSALAVVERAKEMSLNRRNDSAYGVVVSSSSISIFSGQSSLTGNTIFNYKFEDSKDLYNVNFSNGLNEIVFSKTTGLPNATGQITFKYTFYTKLIDINGAGLIEEK